MIDLKDALFPEPHEEWYDFLREVSQTKIACPHCNVGVSQVEAAKAAGIPFEEQPPLKGMYQCPECTSMLQFVVGQLTGGARWRRICWRKEFDDWREQRKGGE